MLKQIEAHLDWGALIDQVEPALSADALAAAKRLLVRIGIPEGQDAELWKKVSTAVQKMVRERAAELVGKRVLPDGSIVDNPNADWAITETTRANLRELATEAVDEGWTVQQLQSKIIGSEDFSASRALTIARTEKAYAAAHGEHQAAKSVGMKFKGWIAHPDCCEECQANADAGRIPIDEPFPSGDDCVPCHPNDECAMGYYEASSDEGDTD